MTEVKGDTETPKVVVVMPKEQAEHYLEWIKVVEHAGEELSRLHNRSVDIYEKSREDNTRDVRTAEVTAMNTAISRLVVDGPLYQLYNCLLQNAKFLVTHKLIDHQPLIDYVTEATHDPMEDILEALKDGIQNTPFEEDAVLGTDDLSALDPSIAPRKLN